MKVTDYILDDDLFNSILQTASTSSSSAEFMLRCCLDEIDMYDCMLLKKIIATFIYTTVFNGITDKVNAFKYYFWVKDENDLEHTRHAVSASSMTKLLHMLEELDMHINCFDVNFIASFILRCYELMYRKAGFCKVYQTSWYFIERDKMLSNILNTIDRLHPGELKTFKEDGCNMLQRLAIALGASTTDPYYMLYVNSIGIDEIAQTLIRFMKFTILALMKAGIDPYEQESYMSFADIVGRDVLKSMLDSSS